MKAAGDYKEIIASLYGLQKYGIKFGLSKTTNLLEAFGNPHRGRSYIHIAGSNGKGSVGAMMESVLLESGLKVGFYVSPHLVRFTERFRINGREMSQEAAADLAGEVMEKTDPDEPPTFFEFTTAMALIYFAREETDIAIMEVGMGGRLDATNVIIPLVSAITNISLEHQYFLGQRLRDIAAEKAGIIKKGVDLVTAATQAPVLDVIQSKCESMDAPFWRVGKDVRYRTRDSRLNYYGLDHTFRGLALSLRGAFQYRNAALALAALELLQRKGYHLPSACVRKGLGNIRWPGRMYTVSRRPRVILDGAHNPKAMRLLADSVRTEYRYKRLVAVLGVMEDKNIKGIIQGIVSLADYVIFTRAEYYRSADPHALLAHGRSLGIPSRVITGLPGAIEKAKEMVGPDDILLVCGSLFIVGEALSYLEPKRFVRDGV